jgi:hypothetical protein
MPNESSSRSRASRLVGFVLAGIGLAIVLTVGAVAAKRWLTETARARANEVLKRAAAYADVDYENVDVDLLLPVAHVHALTIRPVATGLTLRVGDVAVRKFTEGALAPLAMDLSLRDVTADLPPQMPAMPWALANSLDLPLVGDVTVAYRYDATSRELDVERLGFALHDLGALTLSANVAGVSFEVPSALPGLDLSKLGDPATTAAVIAGMAGPVLTALHETALARAELRYDDRGLLPRLVMAAALQSQQSVVSAARRLSDGVEDSLNNAPGVDAAMRAQIRQFLARPGALTLVTAPKVPIPIMRFVVGAGAGSFPDLHLTMSVSEGPDLVESATAAVPQQLQKLATASRGAMRAGAWDDARRLAMAAHALAPDDELSIALQRELPAPTTTPAPPPVEQQHVEIEREPPAPKTAPAPPPVEQQHVEIEREPPPSDTCDDWRSAPPRCAVGFVRRYYENLSRGDCAAAAAMWGVRQEDKRAQCEKAASAFRITDIAITNTDTDGVDVALRTDEVDKQKKLVVANWALSVRLVPGNPWSIVDLRGNSAGPAVPAGARERSSGQSAAGSPPSLAGPLPDGLPFAVGARRQEIRARLGQPSYEKDRGYWANTTIDMFPNVVPGSLSLSYLYDTRTLRVRQAEATVPGWASVGYISDVVARMAGRSVSGSARRALASVGEQGARQAGFSVGSLQGTIERQDETRIYVAVWEPGTHRR